MSIVRVQVKNYKSIKNCDLSIKEIMLIIGCNGAGKSNLIESIKYFFSNMTTTNIDNNVFDVNNFFSNEMQIIITFDLSKLITIVTNQRHKSNFANDFNQFFDEQSVDTMEEDNLLNYCDEISKMTENSHFVTLKMAQIKKGGIKWNYLYRERVILYNLFPLFFVDARNVDVLNWHGMWESFSELGKFSNSERYKIKGFFEKEFLDKHNEFSKKWEHMRNVLQAASVTIQNFSPKAYAEVLFQLVLGGTEFIPKGKKISYYSIGTSYYYYLKLLLSIINEISLIKLKEPILIIDEPEHNLHNTFINELADLFVEYSRNYSIILATHSPGILRNIIRLNTDILIYNVNRVNKYSQFKQIPFLEKRAKYVITDEHFNMYFSKATLFVEGETEIELFNNYYLREIYPCLKQVNICHAVSNDIIYNSLVPSKTKADIPYLVLADMDKVISIDGNNFEITLISKNGLMKKIPSQKKEKFLINQKKNLYRSNKYVSRLKFIEAIKKKNIDIHSDFLYSCEDEKFIGLLNLIKSYFCENKMFVCYTTIEGLLITKESSDDILGFLAKQKGAQSPGVVDLKSAYENLSQNHRANLLRLIFHGKTDLLQSAQKITTDEYPDLIAKNKMSKTSWVSAYLEYYCQRQSNILQMKCESIFDFKKNMKNEHMRKKFKKTFEKMYPELDALMQLCDIMIRMN